ncbi:unnamed protein product, partial [Amoebophrya sp. A120]|eukprot:GSA120T00003797001.1
MATDDTAPTSDHPYLTEYFETQLEMVEKNMKDLLNDQEKTFRIALDAEFRKKYMDDQHARGDERKATAACGKVLRAPRPGQIRGVVQRGIRAVFQPFREGNEAVRDGDHKVDHGAIDGPSWAGVGNAIPQRVGGRVANLGEDEESDGEFDGFHVCTVGRAFGRPASRVPEEQRTERRKSVRRGGHRE